MGNTMNAKNRVQQPKETSKAAYQPPMLKRYGAIGTLTSSGSGNFQESAKVPAGRRA